MIKRLLITALPALLLVAGDTYAQNPSLDVTVPPAALNAKEDKDEAPKVETVATYSLTGYVDAYYGFYTDDVGPGKFQKFPSVSPRSNSPSLNTAMLSFQYNGNKMRTMVALHVGDIANSTWSNEYGPLMEAHAGVKLRKNLWLDAGMFRTHFGTEYLLPSENITSSVAVGTYYEPYYESGIRLNYSPTSKLDINLYLLNGYGIYTDNNEKKSFGAAVTYTFNDNWNIGYTNYTGDDGAVGTVGTSVNHLRIAQNAFLNFQKKKFKVQIGGDYILQQNSGIADAAETAAMYSALATVKFQAAKSFGVYARGEMLNDADGIMTGIIEDQAGKRTGYKIMGATLGAEYKPTAGSYVKLEGRVLQMDKEQWIFKYNGAAQNNRFEVMLHAGITFDMLRGVVTHTK